MSKARNIAALSTVEVGATADQTKADLNAIGVSGGRKNLIINGGFDVSQRGTYTTATSAPDGYYLDRWAIDVNAITANIQQLTTTVDGGTVKTMKIIATSSATGALQMYQVVEAFAVMAGRTLTFSARVKSNQSSTRLQIYDGVSFIDDAGSRHTGGGDWENLSLTFTPSSSSTTLNARITGYDGLIALTTGDYIEVANAQLELGSVATDFEHRSYGEELALCQRYYSKNARAIGVWQSTAHFRVVGQFATTMRATPSVSRTDSAGYHENWHIQGFNGFTINTIYGDNKGFDVYCNSTSGSSTAREMAMMSKDTIQFDAEL